MAGAFLSSNTSNHSWLCVLMPGATYNHNACCENTTQTLEVTGMFSKMIGDCEKTVSMLT